MATDPRDGLAALEALTERQRHRQTSRELNGAPFDERDPAVRRRREAMFAIFAEQIAAESGLSPVERRVSGYEVVTNADGGYLGLRRSPPQG